MTQRRMLTVIALVLVVCSFLPARWGHAIAAVPRRLVSAAIAPPGALLTAAGASLRPGAKRRFTDDSAAQVREQLGQALQYNSQLIQINTELRKQIARLTQTSNLIDLGHARPVDARVTSLSANADVPVLTLDHGTTSGIGKGMAVVSGFNLVGRVIAAGRLTCEVKLIATPGDGVTVRIVPPSAKAPPRQMTAWIVYQKDGWFRFDPGIDKPVQVGDLAHLADDRWPRESHGFVVGKVMKILKHPTNPLNLKRVIIQPLISLEHLHRVTVLVPK